MTNFKLPGEASKANIQLCTTRHIHLFIFLGHFGFPGSRSTDNFYEPDLILKPDPGSQHCLITNQKHFVKKIKENVDKHVFKQFSGSVTF
jgi:hypothetical protein